MIFYGIIGLLIGLYLIKLWVSLLNYNARHNDLPGNVKDVYDQDTYQKWLSYTMESFRLSLISKSLHLLVLIIFLILGVFGALEVLSQTLANSLILETLLFLIIYLGIRQVIDIPFSYYGQFVIEEKYGFNKSTKKTFVFDQLKGMLLIIVLLGGIVSLLMWVYLTLASWFFILAWVILTVFTLVFALLNTKVFVKIFNKLTPLEDGSLKNKIESFVEKSGYKIKAISIMDASKRSTKLNAFFSGFGKFKDIVLYDTLVEKLEEDEIVAVLAHEIAHGKHNDVARLMLQQVIVYAIYVLVIGFTVSNTALSTTFGLSTAHFGFGLVLFVIFIEPISLIIGIPLNYLSRQAEYKADRYAALNGYQDEMKNALIKLGKENFSNLTPHPLYVKLYYSHPPISDRLENIDTAQ
jgi:STE24 endopeptidase